MDKRWMIDELTVQLDRLGDGPVQYWINVFDADGNAIGLFEPGTKWKKVQLVGACWNYSTGEVEEGILFEGPFEA